MVLSLSLSEVFYSLASFRALVIPVLLGWGGAGATVLLLQSYARSLAVRKPAIQIGFCNSGLSLSKQSVNILNELRGSSG